MRTLRVADPCRFCGHSPAAHKEPSAHGGPFCVAEGPDGSCGCAGETDRTVTCSKCGGAFVARGFRRQRHYEDCVLGRGRTRVTS